MPTTLRKSFVLGLAGAALSFAAATVSAAPTFDPEVQPIGYLAQPRSTSLDVRDGNQLAYYIDYERQYWSGNLKPFNLAPEGRLSVELDTWPGGVAPVLNVQNWDTGRKIGTLKPDGTAIPFRYNSLDNSKVGKGDPPNQQGQIGSDAILQYLRGNRANEAPKGELRRIRRNVLGDIIRSRPAYVAGTVPMIYVGANDGMLHAFRADSGVEVYAYIPSMFISKLANLAPLEATGYTHKHFVDASPRAIQVQIGGSTKRILVGGLGAGGRGLYALDITGDSAGEPATEQAAANKIMWEITNTSTIVTSPKAVTNPNTYANLGYTYGEPIIGKSNYVISGTDRDVIFMPNGYMSTTGKATLFVINPANGAKIAEIDTGEGSNASATSYNGLSSPTPVDTNGDGRIDYLYAGDLNGNMWKFDVSSTTPASWSATKLYATSPAQSITIGPAVADHPRGGRIVAFGTGRALMDADFTDNAVHYMYGIWDGAPVGATTLLTQTLSSEETYTSSDGMAVRRVRTLSVNSPDWTTHRGWKVALPAGERFVGDRHTLTNARVYGNTFNPTVNLAGATASPVEAVWENWKFQFNFLTGGGQLKPVFDLNMDGSFNDTDLLEVGSPARPLNERVAASLFQNAGVTSQPVVVTTTVGSQDLYTMNPNLPARVSGDPGVSGGHFDVDVYYPTSVDKSLFKGYVSRKHIHEYDDKFGVTGVNMRNASDPTLNLSNASYAVKRTSPQTQFKVLISHQYLNPAAMLRIGPSGAWASVKDYGGQASTTDAQTVLNDAPNYTYDTIGNLVFGLPVDAFQSKNWNWSNKPGVGNQDIRAGLIPTQTGCVKDISDSNFVSTAGPQGERHNGSLVVQLIAANTPASALELVVAGKPEYGWRVKASEYRKHMLALWTYFWHHPNGKCYGASGWVKDPPQDPGDAEPGTPPPGTDDPKDGYFNAVGNNSGAVQCSGDVKSRTQSFNKATLTLTENYVFTTGCTMQVVTVRDGTGEVTETTTVTPTSGTPTVMTRTYYELERWTPNHTRTAATIGRISWRELIRE